MAERLRVGLIGAGRIGKGHARTLAAMPEVDLVAVADVNAESARAVAGEVGVGRWTTDPTETIADPAIDAVVIASSTDTHAALIVAAAKAGTHVFCEKPVALDLETTDVALAAVAAAGVGFQIGFQRRFDPAYAKAKALIADGALGAIETIRDAMRDPAPPPRAYAEASGGLYRDMTIHNFDCVRWLMGAEPEQLFAMGSALVDPSLAEIGEIDTSVVTMRFPGGALAVIDNGRRSGFGYDVRTEIFGSKGALLIGYREATPLLHLGADGVRTDHVHFFLERFACAYAEELRAFVAAVRAARPPDPGAADARAALTLAYAAEASRAEGRPVDPGRWTSAQVASS
ncbi:MAG: Myo-inositol 2-dehydrogenase [uncultured Thermomicrobiales bacterium]|uniref:Myo-inositol 2-dehydrogenase n=1 Tax=uncultured Thermomicrobiales bacterium TaxID=1645740 RepID=A0A6J4UDK3_9BACT|nr:MAG: Myo-inositol 2-dehydrogenase [uncultured Thermomicrobiales bacterium]